MAKRETFIAACYQRHAEFLTHLCRQMACNQPAYAELIDLCIQDTFVQAYADYPEFSGVANPRAWLARACMDRLMPYVEAVEKGKAHEAFRRRAELGLAGGKRKRIPVPPVGVSPEDRRVFYDYFVEGCSVAQIGQRRGCGARAVNAALRRIRRAAGRSAGAEKTEEAVQ